MPSDLGRLISVILSVRPATMFRATREHLKRRASHMGWRWARNLELNPAEREHVADLLNTGFTGKWLIFIPEPRVRPTWTLLFEETEAGRLGYAAKVDDELNPRGSRVSCVYTRDYRDHADVARVLLRLRDLGFNGQLTYKEDAATDAMVYRGGSRGPAALYLARPYEIDYETRRDPYLLEDSKLGRVRPMTVKALFDIDRADYGHLPDV